jgi:hypothetical protein
MSTHNGRCCGGGRRGRTEKSRQKGATALCKTGTEPEVADLLPSEEGAKSPPSSEPRSLRPRRGACCR